MKRFLVACLAVGLTGCGWLYGNEGVIHDRANDYQKAKTEPRMQIPEGVPPNSKEEDYLTIPPLADGATQTLPADFEIPVAPPLLADNSNAPSSDDVSLNEMKETHIEQANVSDKYNTQMVTDENQHAVLKLTGRFNEVWDDIGEVLKVKEVEIVDLNRSTGVYFIKSDDITMQLKIKEADGTVIISVEEDATAISEETRQTMLKTIREQLAHAPQ